jgi:hypothetical protein
MKACAAWVLVLMVVLWPSSALADGKAFGRVRDTSSYAPLAESEQRAAILYRDGIERLVIAVNLDLKAEEEALWIFPVPGTPEQTKLDLVDSFPVFKGENPFGSARNSLRAVMLAVRTTQIWPLLGELFLPFYSLGGHDGSYSVQTEIEKWGLHTEVVSVGSVEGLAEYMRDRKSQVAPEELRAFEPYLSGGYVLIATWVSSAEQVRKEFPQYTQRREMEGRWPCVYVEFPTKKAFYPLRPTSSYGDAWVVLTLFVMGYVRPETGSGTPPWARPSHFWLDGPPQAGPANFLSAMPNGRFPYSVVRCGCPANVYSEDLWFTEMRAPSTFYARLGASTSNPYVGVPVGALLIGLLSYVAGGLTGLMMFGRWKGYAAFGLWNLTSLLGLCLAVRHAKGEVGENVRRGRGQGLWRVPFEIAFSVIFLLASLLAWLLLSLPLLG